MIAFVDDLDEWLKLRKRIVQLSKAREKVHESTKSNETTTSKEKELVKEINDEVRAACIPTVIIRLIR